MKLQTLSSRCRALALPSMTSFALFMASAPVLLAQEEDALEGKTLGETLAASGTIGLLIVVLSVVALAVIIENFVSLKRDKLAPPELIDEIQALFDEEQYQEAMELCEKAIGKVARPPAHGGCAPVDEHGRPMPRRLRIHPRTLDKYDN